MAMLEWNQMVVQYHQIWLKTISDRIDSAPPEMPPSDGGDQTVTLYPPTGATITVRSDWGPIMVWVWISDEASAVPPDSDFAWHNPVNPLDTLVSAPDLTHLDGDWEGTINLRDSVFDLYTFDNMFGDKRLKQAGDHRVQISWRYDHSRDNIDEFDPTPYQEHVIFRFL